MSEMIMISLEQLQAHPANSNVMPVKLLDKLADHIDRTDRYPPVIVRKLTTDSPLPSYQILDGHHRVHALRRLGRGDARCVVWDVDDAEALLLLATLNRLQGHDDPRKRAALLDELREKMGDDLSRLSAQLPEDLAQLKHVLSLHQAPPAPAAPLRMEDLPVAVTFFLLPAQKSHVESTLKSLGGSREEALLQLIESVCH